MPNNNASAKRGRPPKPKEVEGDNVMDAGKEIVKSKARGKNSPVIGDNGVHTKPGDNTRYSMVLTELYKWGRGRPRQHRRSRRKVLAVC